MRDLFTATEEREIETWARKKGLGVAEAVHDLVLQEIQAARPPLDPNTAAAQALSKIVKYDKGFEFSVRTILEELYPDHNFLYTAYPTGERKPSSVKAIVGKKLASFDSMSVGGYKVDRVEDKVNVFRKQ